MDDGPTTKSPSLSRGQQLGLWLFAAFFGLALAAVLQAGALASIGLVALVGIIAGFAVAAVQQIRGSSGRGPS